MECVGLQGPLVERETWKEHMFTWHACWWLLPCGAQSALFFVSRAGKQTTPARSRISAGPYLSSTMVRFSSPQEVVGTTGVAPRPRVVASMSLPPSQLRRNFMKWWGGMSVVTCRSADRTAVCGHAGHRVCTSRQLRLYGICHMKTTICQAVMVPGRPAPASCCCCSGLQVAGACNMCAKLHLAAS
jgi:hypothetical protein